jgi:hypothetical protein
MVHRTELEVLSKEALVVMTIAAVATSAPAAVSELMIL